MQRFLPAATVSLHFAEDGISRRYFICSLIVRIFIEKLLCAGAQNGHLEHVSEQRKKKKNLAFVCVCGGDTDKKQSQISGNLGTPCTRLAG